jgi:hypothetical protein
MLDSLILIFEAIYLLALLSYLISFCIFAIICSLVGPANPVVVDPAAVPAIVEYLFVTFVFVEGVILL